MVVCAPQNSYTLRQPFHRQCCRSLQYSAFLNLRPQTIRVRFAAKAIVPKLLMNSVAVAQELQNKVVHHPKWQVQSFEESIIGFQL